MSEKENESARLTVDEIGVMREIIAWCKESNVYETYCARWEAVSEIAYRPHSTRGRAVDFNQKYDNGASVAFAGEYSHTWKPLPARTFTEAVDMLVALGFLPPRFSSAYQAGWGMGIRFAELVVRRSDPAEMDLIAAKASMPAGSPVW